MIGYVTIGTNNLLENADFYDALAAELGVGRMMEDENYIAWGEPGSQTAGIGLSKPWDKKAATVGNGMMVALAAKDRAQVDRLYEIAMQKGGTDEGPPGERFPGFYAAYFRDRDGNKLNAFVMEAT